MLTLTPADVRSWRAAGQFLARGRRASGIEDVMARVVALQSQDLAAAAVGLWTRCHDLGPGAVDAALGGPLRRGWFLRGTLHHVAAADAGWLLRLFGPAGAVTSERRCAQLGVDGALLVRAGHHAAELLTARGPLTRAELTVELAGLGVPATGQAPFHVLRHAALTGLLRHGGVRDGEQTFVAAGADDSGPDGPEAAAELARRYVHGHGPATAEDFATWSGLSATVSRRAWAALRDLTTVSFGGRTAQIPTAHVDELRDRPDHPDVRLLPAYDGYLLAHRGRELVVPAEHAGRVWPGGGVLRPCVLVDGLAVATWGGRTEPVTEPFDPLDPDVEHRVGEQVAALRRHLAAAT